ncbi:hypothetical protein [Campylobacter concisus]|nr:hypothetical protein [Campylobacter concisus]
MAFLWQFVVVTLPWVLMYCLTKMKFIALHYLACKFKNLKDQK